MDKGQKRAFNTHIFLYAALFSILLALALTFWMDGDKAISILCFVFCAVPIFAFIISPTVFIFDREGITIVYLLGMKERILWSQIRSITKIGTLWRRGGGLPVFEITYPRTGKYPFFMDLSITRNRRTKKLLNEYYKGDIEKY